jgi:hypothetical protein
MYHESVMRHALRIQNEPKRKRTGSLKRERDRVNRFTEQIYQKPEIIFV